MRDNTSEDVIPTFSLGPGQYLVIAASAAGFAANHPGFSGNLVTLEGTLGNGLGNTGDRLLLLAPDGQTVDAVSYGSDTSAFTPSCPTVPAAGQSLARVPAGQDTDSAADWLAQALPNPGAAGVAPPPTATLTATVTDQPSTATVTPSATPTPSATRTPTPTATPVSTPSTAQAGAVIITEIMQNPAAVADSAGEWFEVFNTTAAAIDLNGWTLRDAGSESHRISAGGPLWLPAGGYLVLGRNADRAANGGVLLAYQYSGFTLGNDDDEIILLDGAGREVNAVAWDNGATFPDPNGASMALLRPGLDNRRGENWRASFRAWPGGAGDFGSPGAANPIPPAGRIEGYVYEDLNGDGWRDAGEPGIANVWMALADGRGTHTYSGGWYGFADLPAGTYTVTEGQPAGYISTSPDELVVYLADGQASIGHDFGELRAAATATPTPTPTAAPGTPTVTPPPGSRPRLLLSEVLYDAVQDGTDAAWEWVEVYLAEGPAVNLAGWRLRDNVAEDVLPAFILEPGSYLVIAASAADFAANHPGYSGNLISLEDSIGNGLGNSGDVVILLAPDGTVADAMSYGNNTAAFDPACPGVGAGASLARVPSAVDGDSAADWHAQAQPNPGGPPPAPASPTPSPSATPTPTPTSMGGATPTATPSAPALTITPTPSPTPPDRFTMTPTASPAGTATPTTRPAVRLNEYLPRPQAVDWNGDGTNDAYDEYIELFNPGPAAADLTGWALDDIADGGSHPYVFPPGSQIAPGGFAVFYRSLTGVALNQDADTVRLLASDGAEVDRAAYANPRPDTSYSRMTDGAGAWTDGYPPSPGGPNRPGPATVTPTASPTPSVTSTPTAATVTATPTRTPTPTPTGTPVAASVFLNELLPDPERTDWDSDGSVTFEDEWIELVNTAATVVELGGWAIADDTKTYTLPLGSRIWPGGYLLLFRTQTHLSLGDTHDAVTLLRPDGLAADRLEYAQGPGDDRSFCRQPDATGGWTGACLPSPGAANQPWPTPQPSDVSGGGGSAARSGAPWITSIAAARAAPEGTLVTVTGAVTLPSGGFGRSIYIQEDGAGIRVYLRSGEYGALALGDRLQVTGWTDDAWGELEIAAANPGALVRLGAGAPPAPAYVATGAVGEAHEGRLIWIAGKIVKWETTAILLDDGSGPLRIYFPTDLSWHRPYVQIGETWAAQGVVGQYVAARPYVGGYRLVVRLPSDVGLPPLFLPVTGADTPIK